jgi:hypothetical protein
MKERMKHREAFEFFYSLGGAPIKNNALSVSKEFKVTERTFWNWYKKLDWKEKVQLRDIEVSKGVEQKTNSSLIENKAKYLSYVHRLFDDLKKKIDSGEFPVEIKSVSDLDKAIKLGLILQDQATEKTETNMKLDFNLRLDRLRRIEAKHDYRSSARGAARNQTDNRTEASDKGGSSKSSEESSEKEA